MDRLEKEYNAAKSEKGFQDLELAKRFFLFFSWCWVISEVMYVADNTFVSPIFVIKSGFTFASDKRLMDVSTLMRLS